MRTLGIGALALGLAATAARGEASPPGRPSITIDRETTHVTGPVDADGYIDFAAALNRRLGRGIKPADNAVVLLWQAFGPHPEGVTMPPEFFRWLGMNPLPKRGDYFIDSWTFLKEHRGLSAEQIEKVYEDEPRVTRRPWTAKQYPHYAAWLKANEKPLAVVIAASKRPDYFSPLVPRRTPKGSSGLLGALMPGVQKCRALATALAARAQLRIGQGQLDEARQDLLACHRLGRLVARGGTIIQSLVGFAIENIAGTADLALLEGREGSKQLLGYLRELRRLPPLPAMADRIDVGERFLFLDSTQMLARGQWNALDSTDDDPDDEGKEALALIDWDWIFRNGNRWYDRMAAALRVKERSAREKQLDQIAKELEALARRKKRPGRGGVDRVVAQRIGNVMIGLFAPAARKVQHAADRAEQTHRNLQAAFALAAYQRDHGRYPAKLGDLTPRYLAAVPGDLFSGKGLVYRPSAGGLLLYSVGVNGKDEAGRTTEDDPKGDDLVVRLPLPKLPAK